MQIESQYMPHPHGVYNVLVANDRGPQDERDAWKYKSARHATSPLLRHLTVQRLEELRKEMMEA